LPHAVRSGDSLSAGNFCRYLLSSYWKKAILSNSGEFLQGTSASEAGIFFTGAGNFIAMAGMESSESIYGIQTT
jgi:hypothetical protein